MATTTSDFGYASAVWHYKHGEPVYPMLRSGACVKHVRSEKLKGGKVVVNPAELLADFKKEYGEEPRAWCIFCDGWIVAIDSEREDIATWLMAKFPNARVEKGSKGCHLFVRLTDKPVLARGRARAKDDTFPCEILVNWGCTLAGSLHRDKDLYYSILRDGDIPQCTHADLTTILADMAKEFDLTWGATNVDEHATIETDIEYVLARLPSALVEQIKNGVKKGGGRSAKRFSLTLQFYAQGLSGSETEAAMVAFNSSCEEPENEEKVRADVRQVYREIAEGKHTIPKKIQESAAADSFKNGNPQNPHGSAYRVFYDGVPHQPAESATASAFRTPPIGGADAADSYAIPIFSLKNLLSKRFEEIKWILPNAIPEASICMLAAKRASHKTFFALHLAISAASGAPNVLGTPTESVSVLYMDYENGDFELRRRCKGITEALQPEQRELAKKNFHTAIFPRIIMNANEEGETKLRTILAVVQPRLVVCDVMRRMTNGEENSSGTSNDLLGVLQRATNEFGCAFLLLHHMRKGSPNVPIEDEMDEIRGSSDIVASVAVCLKLARMGQGDSFVVKQLKNRYAPERTPIQIHIEGTAPETVRFVNDGEISDAAAIQNLLARNIIEWLICEKKFEFETKEVNARFVGTPPGKSGKRSVEEAMQILVRLEKIRRITKGKYEMVLLKKQETLSKFSDKQIEEPQLKQPEIESESEITSSSTEKDDKVSITWSAQGIAPSTFSCAPEDVPARKAEILKRHPNARFHTPDQRGAANA